MLLFVKIMTSLVDLLAQGAALFHRHMAVAAATIRYALLRLLLLLHLDLLALALCILGRAIITCPFALTFDLTMIAQFLAITTVATWTGQRSGTERTKPAKDGNNERNEPGAV